MRKIIYTSIVLILTISALYGAESVKIEDLFGIPVTRWVFEGSDGINQYQSENAEYGYYFNFQHPNIVEYTFATPITFQNGDLLCTKLHRKGTFEIRENNLIINFAEVIHRIPDTFGKLGDITADYVKITVEAETEGRTELYIKQISGENIFTENDKYKKIKFRASILPVLQ